MSTRLDVAPARRVSVEQVVAVLVIFAVAFLARLMPTLKGSGLFGLQFYDDGVHYAAATGLVHGRLPYRDFLLLHPPGIVVALAPFAELARWVGDDRGFAIARLAFMALGGVNALLVSRFLRPNGRFAAWFGGLFYALFWPAIYSEHTVLLEGLANTFLLIALLLVVPIAAAARGSGAPGAAKLVAAGVLLGLAATIKIWGVVPILVLFGWLAVWFGWRPAWLFLAGGAAGTTAICLPFFVQAPRRMWRMVVVDQVERNDTGLALFERLNEIVGLTLHRPPDRITPLLVVAWALLAASTLAAWRVQRARPVVLLMVALGVLLFVTPTWFVHYTALTAAVMAIVVGVAAQSAVDLAGRRGRALQLSVAGALLLGLVAFSLPLLDAKVGQRFPGRTLRTAVADRPGCVTTDHPSTLILMDVLSRNIDRGCPLVVDLGGASYDLPSPERGVVSRRNNDVFQAYALSYLRTGDSMILARFRRGFGLSNSSFKVIQRWPVLKRAGGYAVRQPSG